MCFRKSGYMMIRRTCIGFAMVMLLMSSSLWALEPTDKWEGPIDYAATGGTFLEDLCSAGPFGCIPGIFDAQGDSVTSTSTADLYGIQDGVHVINATLIWMGSVDPNGAPPDSQLSLTPPQGKNYPIIASEEDLETIEYDDLDADDNMVTFKYYTYRVDVTEVIRRHHVTDGQPLTGSYSITGFEGYAGEPYLKRQVVLAGWSLILTFSIPDGEPKRIYFYTHFEKVRDRVLSLIPSGFQAPLNAEGKLTIFVGEGDQSIEGMGTDGSHDEQLRFEGSVLKDACNSATNVYNSTINTNLGPDEGVCRENIYSIDLDTFYVTDLLTLGATEAEVELSLGQDLVITNYFILSISTKLPDFDIPGEPEKSASVQPGLALFPGQEFKYFIYVQNNGEDIATKVRVRDELPNEVTYVPGSTVVLEPNGERRSVEDRAGGVAPCLSGFEIADSMPPGEAYRRTVEIGVRLNTLEQGVTKESVIHNTGEIISGRGDVYFTNGGIPVTHTVKLESFEGTLYFQKGDHHPSGRFVSPGDMSVVAAHIDLKALEGDIHLSVFRFSPVEETDPLMFSAAELFWDINDDGLVDDGDIRLGEKQTWTISGLVFADFESIGVVSAGEQRNLLLQVDIAEDAERGAVGQLELKEENVVVRGFTSGLPFSCARVEIPGEDTGLSVELGFESPPESYLSQGATAPLMQLRLRTYSDAATVESIILSAEGTVYDPSEVEGLSMYIDADSNGKLDDDEEQVGATIVPVSDDEAVIFSELDLQIPAAGEAYLLLVGEFSDKIGTDKTYQLSINSNDQIDAGDLNVAGAPIIGSVFTFAPTVVECSMDEECDSLGSGWVCDQLNGICVFYPSDGDLDGMVDGDIVADGDEGGNPTKPEDEGGGCRLISPISWTGCGALVLLLTLGLLAGRRHRNRNLAR